MLGIVILAAGLGKRMHSDEPKVLAEVGGEPMIFPILRCVKETTPNASIAVVIGHERERVQKTISQHGEWKDLDLHFVVQPTQRGTGDAASSAMESEWGETRIQKREPVLVLPGDLPLITPELIRQMVEPLGRSHVMRLLTSHMDDPTGYGRVVRRGKKGALLRIVEEKDANLREKLIQEVATSIYFFQSPFLKQSLRGLTNKNAQGEFYLTDVLAKAVSHKKKIEVLEWRVCEDLMGINTTWDLAQAESTLNQRLVKKWALQGVRFLDPQSVWIQPSVQLSRGVVVEPCVQLKGNTVIAERVRLKMGTVVESSKVGADSTLGPYAHLRPESVVGKHVKIGNFVELKKAVIDDHTSVAHLSYLGDATVGKNVNIGCGFVTCNYDGRVKDGQRKHRTTIEDDVFIGSDCQVIAPIKICKRAYIASGSTVTQDVESDALAIARARQTTKPGYAKKFRTS